MMMNDTKYDLEKLKDFQQVPIQIFATFQGQGSSQISPKIFLKKKTTKLKTHFCGIIRKDLACWIIKKHCNVKAQQI